MDAENSELRRAIEIALKNVQSVSLAMSRCTKRYFRDELKKIRKYGGHITRAQFGGKKGVSVIVFDMAAADLDRYSYRHYRTVNAFDRAFRHRRLHNE